MDTWLAELERAERIFRKTGDRAGISVCFNDRATVFALRGRLVDAMNVFKESEKICREARALGGLAIVLGNQAQLLITLGQPHEAIRWPLYNFIP